MRRAPEAGREVRLSVGPLRVAAVAGFCVLLFAATLWLHTRHNDFPWYYHPDEPGKVEQVLGMRGWNFHHPMLLLSVTRAVVAVSGDRSPQAVVEAGRAVSAAFTAAGVVALALLALLARGWAAGALLGVVLALHHQLFELSHYMKEDPALLLGVALVLLAGFGFEKAPSRAMAAALGAACAVAASGKYLGVMMLAVPAVVLPRARVRGAWAALAAVLVVVFALVNLPLLRDWGTFLESFARETKLVVEGQGSVTQSVPHTRYWSIFLANSTPVMWVLIVVAVAGAVRRRGYLSRMEWVTLGFPFAYALGLSFSPKDNDRYFLPASAVFTLLAVAGVFYLADLWRARWQPRWSVLVLGGLLVAGQFPDWTDDRGGLVRYWRAFQRDDTAELVEWVRASIPAGEPVAKDDRVRLPTPLRHGKGPGAQVLPNPVLTDKHVADLGTLEELRARGVRHVITTPSTYERFNRTGLRPKKGQEDDFDRRRLFYAELRRDFGEPVWERRRGTVVYLHPGLEVYRIAE